VVDNYDILARIGLDAYLLARHQGPEGCIPNGRVWERAVNDLLRMPEFHRRQYAGKTALFDRLSLSGLRHELDGCASGWQGCLIVESKAKRGGVEKADVSVFHTKTFDYYLGNIAEASSEKWWRILVSAEGVSVNIRRLCFQTGILLCDPTYVPLPVLLRAATRPGAAEHLPAVKLSELLRLGRIRCLPLQEQWHLEATGELRYQMPARGDLDDLLWLQEELSEDLLDLYDRYKPGALERRSAYLATLLRAAA
jgi:hypothetical protein